MVDLNVNSLQVGDDGRVSFSGLGSGIDFEAAVDGIIAAKRIPVDRLEAKIETNQGKIADLGVTRTLVTALQESLQQLHGAVSFDNSNDLFASKQAFASASRNDGAAASNPANLMGVSVTSQASAGTHTVEVLQTATSNRVGSAAFTSTTDDLGTARGLPANSVSGTIEIAGTTITVSSGDSLNDLSDRINNANTGDTPTGVSATIVSTSPTESFLVLTSDETGQVLGDDISFVDTDGILEDLGILDSGGDFVNELQAAQKALIRADGLLDNASYTSADQADATTALGLSGTLTFNDDNGALIGTLNYAAGDTLTDIADAIANDVTLSGAGITAAIDTDADGSRIQITGSDAFNMVDSSTFLDDMDIGKDPLTIERDSNTVSDLFEGVTLTLFQAEVGTTIEVDIERDLTSVKTGIIGFVDAYNNLRQELNRQLSVDPATGAVAEESTLFGNSAMEEIDRRIESVIGGGAEGVSSAFTVLAQIGVDFVANGEQEDYTQNDTLEINEEQLDEALLNEPEDVKKLFQFNFSSSDPRLVLLSFDGNTSFKEGGYTLDIEYDEIEGELSGVTLGEGLGTVNGQGITINSGGAQGLRLFYSGDSDVSGITLDYSVGVGAKLFFDLDELLDDNNGILATEIEGLTDQNELAEERSSAMIERLDVLRESQLAKFVRMEAALQTMNAILDQVTQITEAMFQDR